MYTIENKGGYYGKKTKKCDNRFRWIVLSIDPVIVVAAGNLIGIGLTKAYDERTKIIEFLYGSTIAKVKKDKI